MTHPLPRYLPKATFADLDMADVQLRVQRPGNRITEERISVGHALFESCPSRVSKRFSTQVGEPGFWHPLSARLAPHETTIGANEIYPDCFDLGIELGMHVFQPETTDLIHRPTNVLDSSFASWDWENVLRPHGAGQEIHAFRSPRWNGVVRDVTAFLHRDQANVEVVRLRIARDMRSVGEKTIRSAVGSYCRMLRAGFRRP